LSTLWKKIKDIFEKVAILPTVKALMKNGFASIKKGVGIFIP